MERQNSEVRTEVDVLLSLYDKRATLLPNDADNNTIVQIDISLSLPNDDKLSVEVWLPLEDDNDNKEVEDNTASAAATSTSSVSIPGIHSHTRPDFQRSISGRRHYAQFIVRGLPPLTLVLTYAADERDYQLPKYSLLSPLLSTAELSALCVSLDMLANENQGLPIVASWVDWLQNSALESLTSNGQYVISEEIESVTSHPSALQLGENVYDRLMEVLKNEISLEQEEFCAGLHMCAVCFDEHSGTELIRLRDCLHYFCADCISSYIQSKLTDGTMKNVINCPENGCDGLVGADVIRRCVPQPIFAKWEQMSFIRTLDVLDDVDWCPRCEQPAARDQQSAENFLGRCAYCSYAFCIQCRNAYHQGTACVSLEEQLQKLGDSAEKGTGKNADEKDRNWRKRKAMDLLNQLTLRRISIPCPKCGVAIQKDGGCNKVTCRMCSTSICYLCGRAIKGYEHFGDTGCQLVTEDGVMPRVHFRVQPRMRHEAAEEQAARVLADPALQRFLSRCPTCKQANLKQNRNNHMRCFNCKSPFCYQCGKRIIEIPQLRHFVYGTCNQHSDD